MAKFNASKNTYKLLTAGVQEARVARIIDLGIQPPWSDKPNEKGQLPKPKQRLKIMFELANDKVEVNGEEKPAWALMSLDIASGPLSNFHKFLKALGLPTDEDIEGKHMLGRPLAVTIEHKKGRDGGMYANITNVSAVSAKVGKLIPDLVGESFYFDFLEPDAHLLPKIGENLKKTMREALNFPGSKLEQMLKSEASRNLKDTV